MERASIMKKRKKIKRRRRQPVNKELEHTVTAKDSHCEQTIQRIAKNHHLSFNRKGHAKNRLYFKCAEKTWNRFYADIRHLCIADNLVACPTWLQKTILENLKKASKNRLWPKHAQKAIEILKTISAQDNALQAAVKIQPSKAAPSTQTNSSPGHVLTSGSHAKNLMQRTIHCIFSCLKNFVRKLGSLRIGAGGAFPGLRDEKYRIDAS